MTREQKYPNTRTFRYYNANPKGRMTCDCTARAISTALEKPWRDVVLEMAQLSVETGYSASSKECIDRYLKQNGYTKKAQPRKRDNTKYTGVEFCNFQQTWLPYMMLRGEKWRDGVAISPRIIANIGGGHIVAIVDGVINDTWNSSDGCIGNYWTK